MTFIQLKKPLFLLNLRAGLIGFLFVFIIPIQNTSAQSSEEPFRAEGSFSVTNKGISIIPSFTLGDPAGQMNVILGRRLRFEPEFRFSLEGQPWSMLFWFRYDLYQDEKFYFRVGAHPAINFKEVPVATINGQNRSLMESRRFLAGELTGSYKLNSTITTALYYLASHGFESTVPDFTNFLSWNTTFSGIQLADGIVFSITPQLYFLDLDENNGFYLAASGRLNIIDIPFSISGLFNKNLDTDIPGSEDNLWNVSLNYSFDF